MIAVAVMGKVHHVTQWVGYRAGESARAVGVAGGVAQRIRLTQQIVVAVVAEAGGVTERIGLRELVATCIVGELETGPIARAVVCFLISSTICSLSEKGGSEQALSPE